MIRRRASRGLDVLDRVEVSAPIARPPTFAAALERLARGLVASAHDVDLEAIARNVRGDTTDG